MALKSAINSGGIEHCSGRNSLPTKRQRWLKCLRVKAVEKIRAIFSNHVGRWVVNTGQQQGVTRSARKTSKLCPGRISRRSQWDRHDGHPALPESRFYWPMRRYQVPENVTLMKYFSYVARDWMKRLTENPRVIGSVRFIRSVSVDFRTGTHSDRMSLKRV